MFEIIVNIVAAIIWQINAVFYYKLYRCFSKITYLCLSIIMEIIAVFHILIFIGLIR